MEIFWAAALGGCLALYVLLDGFDLGIGILFAFAPNERGRRHMMESVAPVWDGNETWLVIAAGVLFGAFPLAYSILVSAFYLPVILMLCGLILRGVAFEYRHKISPRRRWIWSAGFSGGSMVAAFMQGCAIGAFVQVLPVKGQHFTGTVLTWLSPYSILCGVGLMLGYSLLGASWLVHKTSEDVREFGYRIMPILFSGLAAFLVVAGIWVFAAHMQIADKWFQRPFLFVFLAIGGIAGALLVLGWWKKIDKLPLPMTMIMFAAAYLTMVLAVLPYMVPFSLTIDQVVAPHSSLAFLFWFAGIVILPITLAYTIVVYWLFRGRVQTSSDDAHADWHDDEDSHDGPEAYVHEFEHDLAHPFEGHHDTRADDRHEHKQAAAASDDTHAHSIFLPSSLDEVEARVERARDQLGRTLAQLQGRLRPAALARSAGRTLSTPGGLMLGAMLVALVYAIFHDARRRRAVRLRRSQGAST